MRFLKTIFAFAWIGFITFMYYKNHLGYLATANDIWGGFFTVSPFKIQAESGFFTPFLLIVGVLFLGVYLYYRVLKRHETTSMRITPLRVGLFLLLFWLLFFNFVSINKDTTVYRGGTMVMTADGRIDVLDPDDTTTVIQPTARILFQPNEVVTFSSQQLKNFPDYLKQSFYRPTFWQIQGHLLNQVGYVFLALFFIIMVGQVLGSQLFDWILKKRLAEITGPEQWLFQQGIGLAGMMGIVFAAGVGKVLYGAVLWPIFLLILLVFYKKTGEFFKNIWRAQVEIDTKHLAVGGFLIVSYVILLFSVVIMVLRPTPTGWDEIAAYINLPHLVSRSHSLVKGYFPYNWELLITLGFVLFKNTTVALFISFLGGILACASLFTLARRFFSPLFSFFIMTLFYSLPMVVWQSALDMKIDPALFFYSVLAFLSFYHFRKNKKLDWLYLCGFFLGIAMGIKITTVIFIFGLFLVLVHDHFGLVGSLCVYFFSWFLLGMMRQINLGTTVYPGNQISFFSYIMGGLGLICLIRILIKEKMAFLSKVRPMVIFGLIMFAVMAPWILKNTIQSGNLLHGEPEKPAISLAMAGLDEKSCPAQTGNQEFMNQYYLNDETSVIKRFARLPWDSTMNTFNKGLYIQIGFLFLGLIPGLFLFFSFKKDGKEWNWIFVFTVIYFIYWMFTANGIIWYGMPGFIGLLLLMGKLWQEGVKDSPVLKPFLGLLVGIWLAYVIPNYLGYSLNNHLVPYVEGTTNEADYMEGIFPGLTFASQTFANDASPDNKALYRVGTFITYFIPENNRRIVGDESLDFFNCLFQEHDQKKTIERFKNLGIKYLIYTHGVARIERDRNGTLHKKAAAFEEFIKDNPRLHSLYNNEKGGWTFYKIE